MKKIILVFGTRPEAVKMAPLYHELQKFRAEFTTLACVTAQHREMLDQALNVFGIIPDIDLNLMKKGQDLFDISSAVMAGMKGVIQKESPDLILVHGDTTTSSFASIASFYAGVSVGHIEAGLRTGNIHSPFPEEFNRRVTALTAKFHFAPTEVARTNMIDEGIDGRSIFVTGNTVIDAMLLILSRIESDTDRKQALVEFLNSKLPFNWQGNRYILITGHRRENFGEGFLQIGMALNELALSFPEVHFVYPVHLNPNVQEPIISALSHLPNIHLVEPFEYESFLYLLKHCYLVLTDSGGVQEEAPSLSKPVVVMRDTTERTEGIEAGTALLVGADKLKIFSTVSELLNSEDSYKKMAYAHNPYGDGHACEYIASIIRKNI